jgi:hypothetical protein
VAEAVLLACAVDLLLDAVDGVALAAAQVGVVDGEGG